MIIGTITIGVVIGQKSFKGELEIPTGRYEYSVYVDDKETDREIYDTYDVIKIEGNVWTIQDKEANSQMTESTDKID